MNRTLITRPQYVLIFEASDELLAKHLEQDGVALFNFDLDPKTVAAIREHLDSLGPGEKPNLDRFNLPEGVTLRVEHLRPERPAMMVAFKGTEVLEYRDRMKNYVPDGLSLDAEGRPPWIVEVGEHDHNRRLIGAGYGYADALNRDHGRWKWADVSPEQDGSHWAHFDGHHTQVDINVTTFNYHERHDWKGKNNVRGRARWTVALDRVQVGEGWSHDWESAHRAAANYARQMQEGSPMFGLTSSWRDAEKELLGRPVWYREQPAYVDMLILDQGCVVVKPAMAEEFNIDPRFGDDFPQDERQSEKVEILSPHLYWYRDGAENDLFSYTREEATA